MANAQGRETVTLATSPSATVCDAGPIDSAGSGVGGAGPGVDAPSLIVTVTVVLPSVTPAGRSSAVSVIENVSSPSVSESLEVGTVRTNSVLPAVIVSICAATAT